jgi:hypothetical protein
MRLVYLLLLLPFFSAAQPITPVQQKALNAYADYANQSADEVTVLVKSIIAY